MKTCKKCNEEKELEEFVKSKLTLDGTISTCKKCLYKIRHSKSHELTLKDKNCAICNKIKLAKEFPKNKRLIGGLHCYCKECSNKKNKEKEYYKNSQQVRKERRKNDSKFREKLNKQGNESRKRNITTQLLNSCRVRALQKNMDFNIIKEDIIIPEYCPILLTKIECGTKDNYSNSPSVDRIDNTKGYIKGNIQVISKKANTIKNNATIEELILLSKWIVKNFIQI